MRPLSRKQSEADPHIVAEMQVALNAELTGRPKRWFVVRENPRGGLKLGIGMFNPGICRIADLFYYGEPSEIIISNARLIVEAVNACYCINPKHPRCAAQAYERIVEACQSVVALEMSDARHEPTVRQVIELVSNALARARRSP